MHLFTYGTLMFPEVWQIVVGKEFESTPATLIGYPIFRMRDAVYPGITKCLPANDDPPPSTFPPPPSYSIPGLLYLNVDAASLDRLDRFEGEEYRRIAVEVSIKDGQMITADTYVIPTENRHLLTDESWTAEDFEKRGGLERFVAKYAGFTRLN